MCRNWLLHSRKDWSEAFCAFIIVFCVAISIEYNFLQATSFSAGKKLCHNGLTPTTCNETNMAHLPHKLISHASKVRSLYKKMCRAVEPVYHERNLWVKWHQFGLRISAKLTGHASFPWLFWWPCIKTLSSPSPSLFLQTEFNWIHQFSCCPTGLEDLISRLLSHDTSGMRIQLCCPSGRD